MPMDKIFIYKRPLIVKMYKTLVYTLIKATFKDLHIENSKNYKMWYCPHHTDCVPMCCWI